MMAIMENGNFKLWFNRGTLSIYSSGAIEWHKIYWGGPSISWSGIYAISNKILYEEYAVYVTLKNIRRENFI